MKRVLSFAIVICLILSMSCAAAVDGALKVGSSGEAVMKLQNRLIELGYLYAKADGDFGQKTKSAVIAFQEQLAALGNDIEADGVAGKKTLALLNGDDESLKAPPLQLGSRGERVTQLQSKLVRLILIDDPADGVFGDKTQSAVMEFQQAMVDAGIENAKVTGIANRLTLKTLEDIPDEVRLKLPAGILDAQPLALTARDLYSTNCILINAKTGESLFEKNADVKCYPASTTKIMTLLLALDRGNLSDNVTVPSSAGDVAWDSSLVPVTVGDVMPYKDLLYGLMIRSGNDAANAIATIVAGDVQSFVDKMNKRASKIGMNSTHFNNPHGYHDDEHYTTARDMSKLALEALKNDKFKKIISTKSYTLSATKSRNALTINNSYEILNSSSKYYCPYAYGIKTGYTSLARQCYVGAAEKDGMSLIAVVMHAGLERDFKWQDANRLFNYGFASLEDKEIVK